MIKFKLWIYNDYIIRKVNIAGVGWICSLFWGYISNNIDRNQFYLLVWFDLFIERVGGGGKENLILIFHMKSPVYFLNYNHRLKAFEKKIKINIVSSNSYAQIMHSSVVWTICAVRTFERIDKFIHFQKDYIGHW